MYFKMSSRVNVFTRKASRRYKPLKNNYFILVILFIFSLNFLSASCLYGDENEAQIEKSEKDEQKKAEDKEEKRPLAMSILMYSANRFLDFFDIFRLNAAVGPGIGLNIRPTKFAQIGFETYVSARAGLGKNGSLIFKRYGLAYLESEVLSFGAGPLYTGGEQRGFTEVGVTAHLALVGAEAALDLSEITDFFLGFAMIDFKDDDW
jgi:hypothetical protein